MSNKTEKKKIIAGRSTKALLVATARKLFQKGYHSVGTPEIAHRSKVTRGALYHHFPDKLSLFEAVVEEIAREITERINSRAGKVNSPADAIVEGSFEFLNACRDSAIQKIYLEDAPSVLGWKKWRRIDSRYGLGSLKEGLEVCVDSGLIKSAEIDPIAHVISGALNEAVFYISETKPRKSQEKIIFSQIEHVIRTLLQK